MITPLKALPLLLAAAFAGLVPAQTASEPATEGLQLPARIRANIVYMGGPGPSGTARLLLIIDRWSTTEERVAMMEALKSGGQDALIAQMEKADMGRISIDESLGWPIRLAAVGKTASGYAIRIATDRPMAFIEGYNATRSKDYPIGFMEFTISADGKSGEGNFNMATRVGVNQAGDIVIDSLPGNTAPQRLTSVRLEEVKKKKKKD